MTDRNPTLEAMVEEMREDVAYFRLPGFGPSSRERAIADRIEALISIAQACASIAQKEIERVTAERDAVAYHCEQARSYISRPASETIEKNMVSARWHLDKASAALNERPAQ